jgi:hypothetical protein
MIRKRQQIDDFARAFGAAPQKRSATFMRIRLDPMRSNSAGGFRWKF